MRNSTGGIEKGTTKKVYVLSADRTPELVDMSPAMDAGRGHELAVKPTDFVYGWRLTRPMEDRDAFVAGTEYLEFLTLDHIGGGGTAHRKEVGTGDKIYRWLRDNNYPKGFRVMCFNCNYAVFRYGICPHEKRKD